MSLIEAELAAVASGHDDHLVSARDRATAVRAIGDTYAIGVAGRQGRQARAAARMLGVREDETWLPVAGAGLGVADAAFLGGISCHALDWDDFMLPMYGHCSAVLLPAVWPLARAAGLGGRAVVEAFLAGYQVDHLASVIFGPGHYGRGWHATSTIGVLGAAAAASRILGLDAEQASNALAIASSTASGLKVNFGTDTKPLHAGMAARGGVQAAMLAQQGLSGSQEWLTGPFGMFSTFGADTAVADAERVFAGIDRSVHGISTADGVVQKPYTCCGSCHPVLDTVIELTNQFADSGHAVRDVTVHVDPIVPTLMRVGRPETAAGANYSLTWAVAVACIDRAGGPAQFSTEALRRPDIHALRERVTVIPDLRNPEGAKFGCRVEVSDGTSSLQLASVQALGHPSNPMSADRLRSKQREALVPVVGDQTADTLIDTLGRLLDLADLDEFAGTSV